MAGGEEDEDRDRQIFLREIGLTVVQQRIKKLENQAQRKRGQGQRLHTDAAYSSDSGRAGQHLGSLSTLSVDTPLSPRTFGTDSPPDSPRNFGKSAHQNESASSLQTELQEARHEMKERIKKFSEELKEEHRLTMERDERDIRKMPESKLIISQNLKSSVLKMRKNLFQRRMNLSIYKKATLEWSVPALRAEIRKRPKRPPPQVAPVTTRAEGGHRGSVMLSSRDLPILPPERDWDPRTGGASQQGSSDAGDDD